MSQTDVESSDQCQAVTSDGEQCQHSATDGKFCHQHDESDSTVEDESSDESGESAADSNDGTTDQTAESSDDASESADGGVSSAIGDVGPLVEIRRKVQTVAAELIERPLDGVVEVREDGDGGWVAVVEVVERRAIPDTQDILGRYELTFDDSGTVTGYRRRSRYRRLDTDQQEPIE